MRQSRIARITNILLGLTLVVGPLVTAVEAQRPSAPRLLPEDTVAFLRVADARELVARFHETAIGRITTDEQIRPFVGHLYESALDAFEQVQDNVGASLDELLGIPQGELCVALVIPKAGRPQLAVIADTGDQLPVAQRLLERGDDLLIGAGTSRSTEQIGETELISYETRGGRARELAICERDGVIVLTSSRELARQLLASWDGQEGVRTLADNRKFASIMNRSRGLKDEPPQITWFVDPLKWVTRLAQGNLSGQAGLATIKGLGLEGLKALGGGIVLATEEFDGVTQSHVLIGHPREGVLKMLALTSGELTPEPWVPSDAATYATYHWDFAQTYDELDRLYEFFRGDGAWDAEVIEKVSERLGVEFEEAVLEAAAGRVTLVRWIEKPARLNSQATLVALQLKDADTFRDTLDTVAENLTEQMESASYRGVKYYRLNLQRRNRNRNRSNDDSLTRRPEPCAAVLGDYMVLTDSRKFLEEVIATKGDASRSLAGELDFKLVLNKIQRQLGSKKAGGISFQRPEEGFRLMYELATSPATRDRLEDVEHPVLQALRSALKDRPLPPFSEIAKYLAPGGAMLTYDELGLHHIGFTLSR